MRLFGVWAARQQTAGHRTALAARKKEHGRVGGAAKPDFARQKRDREASLK